MARKKANPSLDQPQDLGDSAPGRVDGKQEAVVKLESLAIRVDHLVKLHKIAEEADTDYREAVKTVASNSGLLAATVNKYVKACAGDSFEDQKRKVVQLALIFEEMGG